VIATVTSMSYVFISMNRDRILSLLAGTTPGKFTWTGDFTTHLVIYGLIPVLGCLAYPSPKPSEALSHVSGACSATTPESPAEKWSVSDLTIGVSDICE
jgi:hypothetical protein